MLTSSIVKALVLLLVVITSRITSSIITSITSSTSIIYGNCYETCTCLVVGDCVYVSGIVTLHCLCHIFV